MPRWSLHLAILAVTACGSDDPPATARARDLQTALNPAPPPVDTAKQRADSQFNTCLYVYDSAEKLRECLVLKFEWPAEDAARTIATYSAKERRGRPVENSPTLGHLPGKAEDIAAERSGFGSASTLCLSAQAMSQRWDFALTRSLEAGC